ncbi:MAG: Lrp/AsnC family transcriptional regulator [Chloroflexi bacterium]|nr:Lrp/AsnC family transcriptional regulator [Chloroflexota bacterium]
MYEFDRTDIKIVNLLLEDGRMSASEMSRRMGDISERSIRYRIDRMIDEGVIQISAVVSPEALGLSVKADVWLEVESDLILEVAKKMAAFENVTYVACGIGQNDISIQIAAKDTAEIYYFVTEVIRKVPGVRKTTTSIVPIVIKDVYQWRVPERIAKEIGDGKAVV